MESDYYKETLKKNIAQAKVTLQSLKENADKMKREYGEQHFKYVMALERVSIASEHLADMEYFLTNGVNRNVVQSVAIPHEFLDKLQ